MYKVLALLFVAVLGLGVVMLQTPPPRQAVTERTTDTAFSGRVDQTRPPIPTPARRAPAPSETAALPPSFRGTQVDGGLSVDRFGNLVVREETRRLFDYFLSALGEERLTASVARLRRHIADALEDPAESQALGLLERYLTYKLELHDLERGLPRQADLAAVRHRHGQVQALRARLFSVDEHQAFFGFEEAYDGFTLQRLAIVHDDTLSDQQKALAIDGLRNSLPDPVREALVPQLQQELRARSQALLSAGGSAGQLRQLRQQLVGAEATTRLEALDQRREAWNSRVTGFERDRARIAATPGLAETDKQDAIERLLDERFDARERLRLEASEALNTARRDG